MSRYGIKCFIDPHQDCVSDCFPKAKIDKIL